MIDPWIWLFFQLDYVEHDNHYGEIYIYIYIIIPYVDNLK